MPNLFRRHFGALPVEPVKRVFNKIFRRKTPTAKSAPVPPPKDDAPMTPPKESIHYFGDRVDEVSTRASVELPAFPAKILLNRPSPSELVRGGRAARLTRLTRSARRTAPAPPALVLCPASPESDTATALDVDHSIVPINLFPWSYLDPEDQTSLATAELVRQRRLAAADPKDVFVDTRPVAITKNVFVDTRPVPIAKDVFVAPIPTELETVIEEDEEAFSDDEKDVFFDAVAINDEDAAEEDDIDEFLDAIELPIQAPTTIPDVGTASDDFDWHKLPLVDKLLDLLLLVVIGGAAAAILVYFILMYIGHNYIRRVFNCIARFVLYFALGFILYVIQPIWMGIWFVGYAMSNLPHMLPHWSCKTFVDFMDEWGTTITIALAVLKVVIITRNILVAVASIIVFAVAYAIRKAIAQLPAYVSLISDYFIAAVPCFFGLFVFVVGPFTIVARFLLKAFQIVYSKLKTAYKTHQAQAQYVLDWLYILYALARGYLTYPVTRRIFPAIRKAADKFYQQLQYALGWSYLYYLLISEALILFTAYVLDFTTQFVPESTLLIRKPLVFIYNAGLIILKAGLFVARTLYKIYQFSYDWLKQLFANEATKTGEVSKGHRRATSSVSHLRSSSLSAMQAIDQSAKHQRSSSLSIIHMRSLSVSRTRRIPSKSFGTSKLDQRSWSFPLNAASGSAHSAFDAATLSEVTQPEGFVPVGVTGLDGFTAPTAAFYLVPLSDGQETHAVLAVKKHRTALERCREFEEILIRDSPATPVSPAPRVSSRPRPNPVWW